jgi:peroxiredoxin
MSEAQILSAGTAAPDFELKSAPDKVMRLRDLRGKPVVLAFYPADWSPVCGDQMALYNEMHEEFAELGAQVLGISVDGAWCHAAFAKDRKLRFPLLSDFEPKGGVSRAYGAYRSDEGVSARALFVLDADGVIRWSHLSPPAVNPGADGIFKALESLPAREGSTRVESPRPSAPEARL